MRCLCPRTPYIASRSHTMHLQFVQPQISCHDNVLLCFVSIYLLTSSHDPQAVRHEQRSDSVIPLPYQLAYPERYRDSTIVPIGSATMADLAVMSSPASPLHWQPHTHGAVLKLHVSRDGLSLAKEYYSMIKGWSLG